MANTNRSKGHNYERQVVKDFKDFVVQAECYKRNPQYKKVLADMVIQPTDVPIIFHKAPGGKEYCILHKEDMMELIQMLISNKIINTP